MYTNIYKSLENTLSFATVLKIKLLEDDDIKVCNYLSQNIPNIDYDFNPGKEISEKELINQSFKNFKKFDKSNYLRLKNIFNNVQIEHIDEPHFFAVQTQFKRNIYDNIKQDSGRIRHYEIPNRNYEIDIISLGHEHCHALKDSNYLEHQYIYVLGETIPIFYELINYEHNFLKQQNLIQRFKGLNQDINIFLEASQLLNQPNNNQYNISYYFTDKQIYNFARSYSGVYLNSFYYAIILYNMYKKNPTKILKSISSVLKQEITTYEMLNKLNIYLDIQGETFEKEISNIKKILTK